MDGRGGDGGRGLTLADLTDIQTELEDFAKDIVNEWDRRQIRSDMDKAIYETFGVPFDWEGDTDAVKKDGINTFVSVEHTIKAKRMLNNVLDKLPESISDRFVPDITVEGFLSFSKFSTAASARDASALPNKIYQKWYEVN